MIASPDSLMGTHALVVTGGCSHAEAARLNKSILRSIEEASMLSYAITVPANADLPLLLDL